MDFKELLPNTYQRAKEAFMRECEKDPEFRKEMIAKGVLVGEGVA